MSKFSNYLKENGVSQFFKNWLSLNRWVFFLYILISAAATIYYVRNVMSINDLLKEVQNYSKTNKEQIDHNKILQMEKNKLESAERIIPIAEKNFGLVPMTEPPIYVGKK